MTFSQAHTQQNDIACAAHKVRKHGYHRTGMCVGQNITGVDSTPEIFHFGVPLLQAKNVSVDPCNVLRNAQTVRSTGIASSIYLPYIHDS